MGDEESNYKRVEDREWRKEVDSARALLTTAINVLQEQVREMKRWQRDTDGTLRGHSGHPGLIAEYEKLDDLYRRLYSVVWQDSTGKKGMAHDVDFLMGRSKFHENAVNRRWTLLEKLLLALVSAITAITVALLAAEPVRNAIGSAIEVRWAKVVPPAKQKAPSKHKKVKRRVVAPASLAPTEATDDGVKEDVPDGRSGDVREHE